MSRYGRKSWGPARHVASSTDFEPMENVKKFEAPRRVASLALLFLSLSLSLSLTTGCGRGGAGKEGELAIEPGSERQERRESGVGSGSSGRLQITGARAFDGQFDVACGLFPDKGLQITFDRAGTDTPQVVLRIDDYLSAGNYSGTVIVRDHYSEGQDAPQSLGAGQIRISNGKGDGPPEGLLLSGSFTGTYGGALGAGKISGSFQGCSTNTSS